jgi:hypothetical protein
LKKTDKENPLFNQFLLKIRFDPAFLPPGLRSSLFGLKSACFWGFRGILKEVSINEIYVPPTNPAPRFREGKLRNGPNEIAEAASHGASRANPEKQLLNYQR